MAQAPLASKKVESFLVSPTDTVLRSQQLSEYDRAGRVVRQQDYFYSANKRGVLVKEEMAQYLPEQQLLRERIITYPAGQEPRRERLETRYLHYTPQETKNKRIWRRQFDTYGELSREDTLTYNADSMLINKCSYNYTGATSILCDEYLYKEDTLRKRWRTYSKWTTINGRSQVVEKQTKRRDYRYRYNKRGQLTFLKGTDYSSKVKRCLCYDKEGRLQRDYFINKREVTRRPKTPDGKPDPDKKSRKYTVTRETFLRYDQGNLLLLEQRVDGQTQRKQVFTYQNGLAVQEETYKDTVLVERHHHEYDANGQLHKTTRKRYMPNGNLRYTLVTTYNDRAEPILEEQFMNKKRLLQRSWVYNDRGLLLRKVVRRYRRGQVMSSAELTRYTYTYHD